MVLPKSRFWSSFWTVAGFLFLMAFVQIVADQLFTLFGLIPMLNERLAAEFLAFSRAVVPIWAALTYVDWRWGWRSDNAGLRRTNAARFWVLPGLVAGVLAAGVIHLISTGPMAGGTWELILPTVNLAPGALWAVAVAMVGAFATELVYRGVVVSRYLSEQSGRELLLLAAGTPLAWWLLSPLLWGLAGLQIAPPTGIEQLGTAAFSVFMTLLFLRTNSVWLVAGLRMGLVLGAGLLGLQLAEGAQLILFGAGAALLFFLERDRLWLVRRQGPRGGGRQGGPRKVVYGKTVRGPWGPH